MNVKTAGTCSNNYSLKQPFCPCSEADDLISETRIKNISNSANSYFISIHINVLFRISYYCISSTTHFSFHDTGGSWPRIRVSTTLLGFVGYMLKSRKVKWRLNVGTWQQNRHLEVPLSLTFYSLRLHLCTNSFNIQKFCVLPTMHLCVLRGSQNKQRLFLYTALTGWFL